jgi:hypothetical protein
MKTSNIKTREDAVTKDVRAGEAVEQEFNFPSLGVTVQAKTMDEALIKAKAIIKSKQE